MTRIDFGGAIMALFTSFFVSAGLTGFVISAGGYQLPSQMPQHPGMMAGPGMVAGPGLAVAAPPIQAPAQAAPAALPAAEFKIVGTDLKFSHPTITAKVGQPVTVVLENKGMIEHDIAFPTIKADKPAASLKAVAKPGQSATIEFTPTAAGTYEYICTIPGHKEAGMKGIINVTE